MLDRHIPHRLAIAVMIGGLLLGIAMGYRWFDGRKTASQPPQPFTDWIFPSMSPLVSPPTSFPAVSPPRQPPPW